MAAFLAVSLLAVSQSTAADGETANQSNWFYPECATAW